ncbi:hypothetical protein [Pseudomonas sp. DWRC2-2]|uniref:hypothetical protein n=1 Tax=Pseudomonas sp. DWRC2-2 TaxID=2804567 RepID=UPI003CF11C55
MAISIILLIIQIFMMTAWGEGNLRKTPEGQKVLATLSSLGLFFLRWRANADYKKEMAFLGKAMGWLAIASVMAFFILPASAKPVVSVYCVTFMGLWLSIRVGMDIKSQLMDMLGWAALFFCIPFIFLACDYFHLLPGSLLRATAAPLSLMLGHELLDYQLALAMAIIGGIGGLFMGLMNIVVFSIFPLLLLFFMVVVSKVSKFLLGRSVNAARNFVALYVLVVGPTLLVLHSLQVF